MKYNFLSIYNKSENEFLENKLYEEGFDFSLTKISTTDEQKLPLAKSSSLIFIDNIDIDLKKKLNLYADLTPIKSEYIDILVCTDSFFNLDTGFNSNDKFGRESFDTLSYSELEIERVARIAFEAAEKRKNHLTLIDKANSLTTSKLFRKIISDINEDYPSVYVNMLDLDEAIININSSPNEFDVIITPNLFSGIVLNLLAFNFDQVNKSPTLSIGDTPLGLYKITPHPKSIDEAIKLIRLFSIEE